MFVFCLYLEGGVGDVCRPAGRGRGRGEAGREDDEDAGRPRPHAAAGAAVQRPVVRLRPGRVLDPAVGGKEIIALSSLI